MSVGIATYFLGDVEGLHARTLVVKSSLAGPCLVVWPLLSFVYRRPVLPWRCGTPRLDAEFQVNSIN